MIAFGFGEVFGGLLMSKLLDYFGLIKSIYLNLIAISIMVFVVFYSIYIEKFSWITFLMTFVFGTADAFCNVHV